MRLLRSHKIDSYIFSHENISIFRSNVLFHSFWMELSAIGQSIMVNLILLYYVILRGKNDQDIFLWFQNT